MTLLSLRRLALTSRIVALTGVLVMVASSLLGASILCVGAEGHVSLESIDQDCCADELPSESVQTAESCGDCVDFVLQASTFPMRSGQVEAAVPGASTWTSTSMGTSAFACGVPLPHRAHADGAASGASARHAGRTAPPRSSVALTRLQGVLLRC